MDRLPAPSTPHRSASRLGFTLPEVAVAVAIGAVLLSISFKAAQPAIQATSVRSAETVFRSLHARARGIAVERGQVVRLNVDPAGDSIWIQMGNTRLETFNFHKEFGLDVRTNGGGSASVCMTPRGVADPGCSQPSTFAVFFDSANRTSAVKILPMGQIVEP